MTSSNEIYAITSADEIYDRYFADIDEDCDLENTLRVNTVLLYEDSAFIFFCPRYNGVYEIFSEASEWHFSDEMLCTDEEDGIIYILIDKRNGNKYFFNFEDTFHYWTPYYYRFRNGNGDPIKKPVLKTINATPELEEYFKRIPFLYWDWMFKNELVEGRDYQTLYQGKYDVVAILSEKAYSAFVYDRPTNNIFPDYYKNYTFDSLSREGKIFLISQFQNTSKASEIHCFYFENNSLLMDKYARQIAVQELTDAPLHLFNMSDACKILDVFCEYYKYDCDDEYIVAKQGNTHILLDSNYRPLINASFKIDRIMPVADYGKSNEFLLTKGKHRGIYNIDTDTIRWGYVGQAQEKKVEWQKLKEEN
jgi:hypothetical protein